MSIDTRFIVTCDPVPSAQ